MADRLRYQPLPADSDEETGSASGAITSVQQLGGAFGIAVLGTIFFALLPGAVTHHVDTSAAELRTVLTAAGVPAEAQPAVLTGLRACLHDRLAENDPDVVPPSCQGAGAQPASPALAAYVTDQVQQCVRLVPRPFRAGRKAVTWRDVSGFRCAA